METNRESKKENQKKKKKKMSYKKRKKRDGSGPRAGSYQRKKYGIGKRKKAGIKCPKR